MAREREKRYHKDAGRVASQQVGSEKSKDVPRKKPHVVCSSVAVSCVAHAKKMDLRWTIEDGHARSSCRIAILTSRC